MRLEHKGGVDEHGLATGARRRCLDAAKDQVVRRHSGERAVPVQRNGVLRVEVVVGLWIALQLVNGTEGPRLERTELPRGGSKGLGSERREPADHEHAMGRDPLLDLLDVELVPRGALSNLDAEPKGRELRLFHSACKSTPRWTAHCSLHDPSTTKRPCGPPASTGRAPSVSASERFTSRTRSFSISATPCHGVSQASAVLSK